MRHPICSSLLFLLLPSLITAQTRDADGDGFPDYTVNPNSTLTFDNFYRYLKVNHGLTEPHGQEMIDKFGNYSGKVMPGLDECHFECVGPAAFFSGEESATCELPPNLDFFDEYWVVTDEFTTYVTDEGILAMYNQFACICNDPAALKARLDCLFDKCSGGNQTTFLDEGIAWLYTRCYNEGNSTLPVLPELMEELCIDESKYPGGKPPATVPAGFDEMFPDYDYLEDEEWPQQTATVPPQRNGSEPTWPPFTCEETGTPVQEDEKGSAGKIGAGLGAVVGVVMVLARVMVEL